MEDEVVMYKGYRIEWVAHKEAYRICDPMYYASTIAYEESLESAKAGIDEQCLDLTAELEEIRTGDMVCILDCTETPRAEVGEIISQARLEDGSLHLRFMDMDGNERTWNSMKDGGTVKRKEQIEEERSMRKFLGKKLLPPMR